MGLMSIIDCNSIFSGQTLRADYNLVTNISEVLINFAKQCPHLFLAYEDQCYCL